MRSGLCLSLTAETLAHNLEVLGKYRALVDMVELRADSLRPGELPALVGFPARAALPAILTIRRVQDGGRWAGAERERLRCLEAALPGGWAHLDLEEDLAAPGLAEAARGRGIQVIRSFHDVQGIPGNLEERLRTLPQHPSELPKAAVTPRDTRELVALVETCGRLARTRKILIAMGERGTFTRVLAGRLGSALSYCSAPELSPAAPGHLGPRELAELYRFRSLDRGTRVCGVIGSPIGHSRSPEIHNRGYAALGLNAVYLPFLVEPAEQLREFFRLADLLGVHGLSVTMPFKQAVIPFLSEQDPQLAEIGACNTMVRRGRRGRGSRAARGSRVGRGGGGGRAGRGGWYGTNTDVEGFLEPLRRHAPEVLARPGRAAVIGAGGAARSVVHALTAAGVQTLVLNRTPERAAALAGRFGCAWGGLDAAGLGLLREFGDLIVQATGAGMAPQAGLDPLEGYRFRGTETLYELVYEPELTPVAARARQAGCRIITGFQMLLAQARTQFRLHTGREYPPGLYD